MADLPFYDDAFEDHMKALGRVAAMWADFEFLVNETIWELANIERKAGACITAQMIGPAPRLRTLIALVHLRGGNEALLSDLRKLARTWRGLGADRNRCVHDAWTLTTRGRVKRIHLTADDTLQFDFVETPVEKLDELYGKIADACLDFWVFRERIRRELPPWPRRRFAQSPGIRTTPPRKKERASMRQRPRRSSQG